MVKLTRESKRILYLAASIVSLLFMLFFAWTLVQYFFAPASSTSAQEAPAAQGQTVAGASGTQTDSQTAQTQGSSSSDAQSNADASKTQDSSNQNTSEPSNSGNSTNAVAAPRKENGALSVSVTVDGSAAKGSSFTVNLQVQEGTSVARRLVCTLRLLMGLQSVTTVHRAVGYIQLTVSSLTTRQMHMFCMMAIRLFGRTLTR